jgi:hypothetical protein
VALLPWGAAVLVVVSAPAAVWIGVAVHELVLRGRSRLRPFVLVTPVELFRVDYQHGVVIARALADASSFDCVRQYNQRQVYTGTLYRFRFDKALFAVNCRDQAAMAALDGVLARARALKTDDTARARAHEQYRLLPPSPPTGADQRFARPFSPPWQTVMAFYGLAFFIVIFGAIIISRCNR